MAHPYCTRADIEAFFGTEPVKTWADLNENENSAEIAARIITAIEFADNEIDDYLRGGPYVVPFDSIPYKIKDLTRKLAGCELYAPRGAQDMDEQTGEQSDRLTPIRKEVYRVLAKIRAGIVRLTAASYQTTPKVYVHATPTTDPNYKNPIHDQDDEE